MTPDEFLHWDAFEKLEKRASIGIPMETVSITPNSINFSRFLSHFEGKDRVEVFYQPTVLLLVPSEDSRAYAVKANSISATGIVRKMRIEKGYYPARWIEGKGLLVTIEEPQDLEGTLGD